MYTQQVGELTRDLAELIRKHDGRDLTRTEIIRQLATEASVLAADAPELAHLHQVSALAVEIAVDHPQTVDGAGGDRPDHREARKRLRRQITIAADGTDGRVAEDFVAMEFMQAAMLALKPSDEPYLPCYKPAVDIIKQAINALEQAREEAAA